MAAWDVIVVGAGPAGARCALGLARAGVRVLLVERARQGRDKPCGEGLLPRGVAALRRAGLGDLLDGAAPFRAIVLHSGRRVVEARFLDAPGAGVRRADFDARLVEHAAHAGADVRFEAKVRDVMRGAWMGVLAGADLLRAHAVVGADGVTSTVRRCLGLDGGAGDRLGVVAHSPSPWRDAVDLFLGDKVEVAITPIAGGARSVAALVERRRLRELGGDATRWLHARLGELGIVPGALDAARCTPLGGRARAVSGDGVLLVGDAAGGVDPIIGCGVTLGLLSGELAAAALVAALDGEGPTTRALSGYATALRALRRSSFAAASVGLALARSPLLAECAGAVLERAPWLGNRLLALVAA